MNQNGHGNSNEPYFAQTLGHGHGQANAQNPTPPAFGSYNYEGGPQIQTQFGPTGGYAPQNMPSGAPLPAGGFLQATARPSPGAAMHPSGGQQQEQGASDTPAPTGPQPVPDETARRLGGFVESLVNDSPIKFNAGQRKDMHEFATIGRNAAPTGQVMLELMNRTLMQQLVTLVTELKTDMAGVKKDLAAVQRAADTRFELTGDHKILIRTVTKRFLIEADRTNYTQISQVVLDDLKLRKVALELADIFAHDTKNISFCKAAVVVCGQARNSFRESIQNSVGLGSKAEYEGLIKFATSMLGKYAPSDTTKTLKCEAAVVLKLAILRRFTLDNTDIIAGPDVEDDVPKDDTDKRRKRKKTDIQPKRGKISTANSYFGRLELFLKDKEKEFGSADITSKGWAPYLYKTIKQDYEDFDHDANNLEDLESYAAKIFGPTAGPSMPVGGGSGLSNIASQFAAPM